MYDFSGREIPRLVRQNVAPDQKLLDIGAGWGKYRFLLPEYEFDAIEVFTPNVGRHRLEQYYDQVYVMDAADFRYPQRYGAVIMGDVLEHISVDGAQRAVRSACANADFVFVTVPFEMPQGAVEGNCHEEHIQDDLNAELMAQRYPELAQYCRRERHGHIQAIYVKGNIENRNGGTG